jgi:DNA-directed RNA polymerase specialized sigma24 family protein
MRASGCAPVGWACVVDMSLTRVETRVVNWVRWLDASDGRRGRCASAERHYTAPAADSEGLAHRMDLMSIDSVDAERVQQAFVLLPGNMRRLLLQVYRAKRPMHRIAKSFALPEDKLDRAINATLAKLEAHLDAIDRPIQLLRRGKPLWAGTSTRSN